MPSCCNGPLCAAEGQANARFRKALWIALGVNAAMFCVEIVGGLSAGSVALWADAVDFAGDAANYGLSLAVMSFGFAWRARSALLKGMCMAAFGVLVLGRTLWNLHLGIVPEPVTMGVIGGLALLANLSVAALLYAHREGDANRKSVWLCSRNDAIGNVAVMAAAAGVMGTGSGWADIGVALAMAGLGLWSGVAVIRQARAELTRANAQAVAPR